MESSDFKKFYEEVKTLIKAIGTSSSANEERDERSVENYVRQSANTNTNSQTGGNTMSNTTEPDPQGDIAINKAYPDAVSDAKHVIDQTTRPTGDVTVSDAPEGPVPTNATFDSSATSAIAPTSEQMAEPTEESISKAANCKECGQALPVAKADEITKAEESAETPTEEAKEKPEHDAAEHAEMKKSVWGGAFAPFRK